MSERTDFDCLILGSGLGGSMLAAILARHGRSVLLIDAGTHPRFAIGEATTPDTSFRLKLVSLKYDVPEILNLSTFHKLRDHVSPACGVKRSFSFLYQRQGEEQNPEESHQYPTLAPPMGPDCHFFRQDTDSYMLSVAVGYGAKVRQQVSIRDIQIDDGGVRLESDRGEVFSGRYLVDAAGFRSPVADKLDLRADPDSMLTNARTIFNHMVGVRHYDEVGQDPAAYGLKYPLSQGTLHHVFEGGWFWIIPFNNHHDAVNPLCSVGLMLNRELYPETGMDAETEFFSFVDRFPSMRRQFEGATAVRNWVTTRRVSYHSHTVVGDRYCLLAHAAGFVDPLFSSGLNLTTGHVDILSRHLLVAFDDGDFSASRFAAVESFFLTGEKVFDQVVGGAFTAFRDFDLWDAWYRMWVVALLVGTCYNAKLYLRYLQTGDRRLLEASQHPPYTGVLGSAFPQFRPLFDRHIELMQQVREGSLDSKTAAAEMRGLWRGIDFVPTYFDWSNPRVRTTPAFTVMGVTRMYFWYFFKAPKEIYRALFDWSPLTAYRYILRSVWATRRSSARRRRQYVRDVFKAWNLDWLRRTS